MFIGLKIQNTGGPGDIYPDPLKLMFLFRTVMGFKTALSVMEAHAQQPFLTKSAKDFIWGYDDQLTTVARLVFCLKWGTKNVHVTSEL